MKLQPSPQIEENPDSPILESERCFLDADFYEKFSFRDIYPLYSDLNQDGYYSPNGPRSLRAFQREYNRWKESYQKKKALRFLILEKNSQLPIGIIGTTLHGPGVPRINIGIRSDYRRQGYAEEAYDRILQWLNEHGFENIQHHVHPENTASIELARRMGGIINNTLNLRGEEIYNIKT